MSWFVRRPHIDADDEDWLLETWAWFDTFLDRPNRSLILPSASAFPPTDAQGHPKALHYFNLVRRHMALSDRTYKLIPQPQRADLSRSSFGTFSRKGAAGTFLVRGNTSEITYDPEILKDPMKTVTVFAHELVHDLMLDKATLPPAGSEMVEPATDLAIAYLGFGLFGANSAFEFKQFTDFDRQGWSYEQSGYLTEAHWGFAVALFTVLGAPKDQATLRDVLKPHLVKIVRRAGKYLTANPALWAELRRL